jgi:hypothetical protein
LLQNTKILLQNTKKKHKKTQKRKKEERVKIINITSTITSTDIKPHGYQREYQTEELKYLPSLATIKAENAAENAENKDLPTILVVDSICGSGKTEAAIEYMNSAPSHNRFLYITPYLEEVERIKDSCPNLNFKSPDINNSKKNKKQGFKELFIEGGNIVCTHKLFSMFSVKDFGLAKAHNYTLIMDEVAEVIKSYNYDQNDLYILLNPAFGYVTIGDDGQIIPNLDSPLFNKLAQKTLTGNKQWLNILYKTYCGCLYLTGYDKTTIKHFYEEGGKPDELKKNIVMWAFPVDIFKSFKKVFILTYMFEGQYQSSYYNFFNLRYNFLKIEKANNEKYYFVDKLFDPPDNKPPKEIKKLINIEKNEKINQIGGFYRSKGNKQKIWTALSLGWYQKEENNKEENNQDNQLFKKLSNNTYNFFHNKSNCLSSKDLIWTTFVEYKDKIKRPPFSKESCFLPCTARATNKYQNKHNLAYLVNRYMNPAVYSFFKAKGVEPDQDLFALSEMVQWIFRSAIRNGEPINLYVPSERMRNLLESWVNS